MHVLSADLSLSICVHRAKVFFALLLGSGISSAAGIPTSWGIVTDLLGQMCLTQTYLLSPISRSPSFWHTMQNA